MQQGHDIHLQVACNIFTSQAMHAHKLQNFLWYSLCIMIHSFINFDKHQQAHENWQTSTSIHNKNPVTYTYIYTNAKLGKVLVGEDVAYCLFQVD